MSPMSPFITRDTETLKAILVCVHSTKIVKCLLGAKDWPLHCLIYSSGSQSIVGIPGRPFRGTQSAPLSKMYVYELRLELKIYITID